MDNSLNIKPPQDDAAVKPLKPKRRRKGLGLPAILSIFGGLLIIGAVVGTLIYSQSPERLTGNLTRLDQPIAPLKTTDLGLTKKTVQPVTTLRTFDSSKSTTPTTPVCQEGLESTSVTDSATGAQVDLCVCPARQYPVITAGTTGAQSLTTGFNTTATQITCEPFTCGMTKEELAKISEDYGTLLSSQGLSESSVSTLKTNLVGNYEKWEDANPACQPDEPVTIEKKPTRTCDDVMKELQDAYTNKDKDSYAAALTTLIENGCITECDENFFMAIYSLVNPAFLNGSASSLSFATSNSSTAENYIIKYLEGSCTDCDKTFGLISLYALELSTRDKADLSLLEKLLQVFLKNCQCIELESLLDTPSFDASDYFNVTAVPGNTEIKSKTLSTTSLSGIQKNTVNTAPQDLTNLTNKTSSGSSSDATFTPATKSSETNTFNLRYINSLLFEKAYAQTRAGNVLSEEVKALIESMYNDSECGEEEKVLECKSLNIVSPTTNASMNISEDFDPNVDILEIQVDGTEAVQEYKYSTSDNALELVDTQEDLKKGLKGGPAPGESVTVEVTAIDMSGNELKQCTDQLTISKDKPDDGGEPDDGDKPTPKVCKSLKITKPEDARDGSVTLNEDGYDDETLLIEVVDEGEVIDYRFSSVNDNDKITFNGKKTLDTTDTAVKLSANLEEGDEYIVTVWARGEDEDGNLVGLGDCHDSFTIKRPEAPTDTPDTPPEDTPTTTTISQGEPEPETEELEIPETEITQPTSAPEPTTEPVQVEELHAAAAPVAPTAPAVPKSGPGALIYLVGAGLGGLVLSRRKKS